VSRRNGWLLAGIVAIAAVVRFATLGDQSFDHDEAVTAIRVLHPGLGDTLSVVGHLERSPPLYYILAWLWSKIFGTGEVGLRSLSAVIGTLTVIPVYLAARELTSRRAGLIAAGLVALCPYLVWYSQEARSYALYVLFAAWGFCFFARALRSATPRNLALWAGFSALALCSHYFAVFLIVPQGLWLTRATWPKRNGLVATAATGGVGLALLPLALGQQSGSANTLAGTSLAHRFAQMVVEFVAGQEPGPLSGSRSIDLLQLGAVLAVAVLGIVAIRFAWQAAEPDRRAAAAGALIGVASLAAPFILALAGADFVDPRNLIGSIVSLLVAAAIAFSVTERGGLGTAAAGAAALVFAVVLGAINVSAQMQRPDWRGAAAAIGPPRGPTALIVTKNGDDGMAYYLDAQELKKRFYPKGVRVREIDTLSKVPDINPPHRPFRLTEERGLAPCCTLRRYRSPRPVVISQGDVAGAGLHESQKILVDGVPRVVAGSHESGPPTG
jgi:mannosyltransferase